MPFDPTPIVIVAILAGTVSSIVRSITGAARARAKEAPSAGPSLTTSELTRMIQDAVADGTSRLEARFDGLEKRIGRLEKKSEPAELPPAEARIDPRLLVDDAAEPDAYAEPRRTRTS